MPIKIQSDLPAREILDNENIFVMDEYRAMHQNIRPLQICILNLMPVKQDTELQLLRSLSNTPLQVDVTFMKMNSHLSLNTSATHLNKFYDTFDDLKSNKYDGLIITGAPVEQITGKNSAKLWNGQRPTSIPRSTSAGALRQVCITTSDSTNACCRKSFSGYLNTVC